MRLRDRRLPEAIGEEIMQPKNKMSINIVGQKTTLKSIPEKMTMEELVSFVKKNNEEMQQTLKKIERLKRNFRGELKGEMVKQMGELGSKAIEFIHSDDGLAEEFYDWCNAGTSDREPELKVKQDYIG